MKLKSLVIFTLALAIFTFAASHRFLDSAHTIGMIKKGGGTARHPAMLDRDRDSYVLIATAGVVPPYSGNARVVLEGDPTLKATFHDSGPAIDLGIHRQPEFRDNTYYGLRPKDKIALWVKIRRNHDAVTVAGQTVHEGKGISGQAVAPPCAQCDEDTERVNGRSGKDQGMVTAKAPLKTPAEAPKAPGRTDKWKKKGPGEATAKGGAWRGKGGPVAVKGPMLAFYDTATNERLLAIPIRFTGDKGGDNGH